MVWARFVGSGALALLAYLAVNTLVLVTNPAKFVTQTTDFLGEPVGDLSDEVRLYLAEEASSGSVETNVTWETDATICRFSWSWNTPGGALGSFFSQDNNLCNHLHSVDYYSIEGINTLSPIGMEEECFESVDMDGFRTYKFCDEITGEPYLIRHTFEFDLENITETLGLPESSRSSDIEVLFTSTRQSGIYLTVDSFFVCDEPVGVSVSCELWSDFWGEVAVVVRNATVSVRSAILAELVDLVNNDRLPDSLSTVGMEAGICDAVGASEELIRCSISCIASYPYPSSVCMGSYELNLVKEIRHTTLIISTMLAAVVVVCLALSMLRLGMRTAHGRSRRGYLGPGGSCHHFFEEEGEGGDRLSLANVAPSMRSVKVRTQGQSTSTSFLPFSGLAFPRNKSREEPAGMGVIVCEGVNNLPREVLQRTSTPVAVDCPRRTRSSGSGDGRGTLPICFIVRENVDGSVTNLDVEETHRLLDKAGGRALLDESYGGDHLGWARGFSLADAAGCLLSLWTVHLVAANSGWGSFYWVAALVALARWMEESDVISLMRALTNGVRVTPKHRHSAAPPLPITLAVMEVLYDLQIPHVEVLGLIVTIVWSLLIVSSCGYFVFVLGYEPVYYGGGVYSTKVSLATALSVGTALHAPLVLAGEWVRGSRCGDLGGRLAVSFCLGNPRMSDDTRVGHVNHISELHPTSLETSILCGDGGFI